MNENMNKNIFYRKTEDGNYLPKTDRKTQPVRYNEDMLNEAEVIKKGIAKRVTELRILRDVSAREMSLSIGQGAGYINSIENCTITPSVLMIFEICEYFGITVSEFFSYTHADKAYDEKAEIIDELERLDRGEAELIRKLISILAKRT